MPSKYFIGPTASERRMFPKLSGLGEIIERGREKKRQEKEKVENERLLGKAREKAQDAIDRGDPVAFGEVIMEFPQLREAMEATKGFTDEMRGQQQEEETRTYREVLGDPDNAVPFLTERIDYLERSGRNADQARGLLEDFQTSPELGIKNAEFMYSVADFEEFKEYRDAIADPEPEDMGIVQIFGADGRDYTALTDGKGNYFDNQGKSITVNIDDRIVRGSLTGGVEAIGMGDLEARELRSSAVGTINFANTALDAIALLDETEDINTFVAGAAGIINDLQQEFTAIGRQLGVDFDVSRLDPDGHEKTFDELGIENARMKSLITTLAYARALSNNPDGRISTPDLREAIKEIGASAADPRAFKQVLEDVSRRAARSFRTNYRARTGQEYAGEYGEIGGAPASVSTDAEYESLAPGTEYIMDGKTYRKPG